MLRRRISALVLALALLAFPVALPAASFAQSAGDDQYQDPLSGQSGGGHTSSGGGSSGSHASSGTGTSGSGTSAPAAAPSTATAHAAASKTSPAAATRSSRGELPRTGTDVAPVLELGVAMLLTGLVGRRAIVRREQR